MKYALILEKDERSSTAVSRVLSWLGYVTAPVQTADQALNVASAIKFDVIITCTAKTPDDRRSLTGELKRAAPEAAIILASDKETTVEASLSHCPGICAVVRRPASLDVMRNIVEFGIDGFGLQLTYLPVLDERRRQHL